MMKQIKEECGMFMKLTNPRIFGQNCIRKDVRCSMHQYFDYGRSKWINDWVNHTVCIELTDECGRKCHSNNDNNACFNEKRTPSDFSKHDLERHSTRHAKIKYVVLFYFV